ncbi:MAG: alpha/beta hydrolase, partial [Verrucomicrobia bacterium]|nr:alpha/beta hydrolase [Verrucomicrobiota bacterium]
MYAPIHHILLSTVLLFLTLAFTTFESTADPTPDHVINIWPSQPPGEPREIGEEQDMTKDTDPLIAGRRIIKLGNVSTPQAHVFLAPEANRSGASVVICPGGGFSILAWDLEGTEVA